MSIKLCIGNYAQKGYEPEKMGIYVYSLEELCFFIKENACILDESLIDEAMGEWLEQECGLPVLGEEVKKAVIEKTSLKTFVEMILIFSGFFTSEMNQEIIDTIVKNSSLSMYEKRKAKADMLVRKKTLWACRERIYTAFRNNSFRYESIKRRNLSKLWRMYCKNVLLFPCR